jgi:hypothetical protein
MIPKREGGGVNKNKTVDVRYGMVIRAFPVLPAEKRYINQQQIPVIHDRIAARSKP